MEFLRKFAAWIWNGMGNILWLFGLLASYSIPAWAARMTGLFSQYAPFSWVCVGFFGALLFAITYALFGWARNQFITASVRQRFYRQTDRFNPMDTIFQSQRIALSDLANPMEQVVKNKKFLDCEMIGPANLLLLVTHPQAGKVIANSFTKFDAVVIADDAVPESALAFVDCDFERRSFYNVVLLIQEKNAEDANKTVNGMHWITPGAPIPVNTGPTPPSSNPATIPQNQKKRIPVMGQEIELRR